MSYRLPNGAYFFIENTPLAAIAVSALSNAANAVATLPTGHSVVEGDDVLIVSGWGDVNDLTARVIEVDGDDVTLGGIDTSNTLIFPPGAGIGSLRRITGNWTQIDQNLGVTQSGGEQQYRTIEPLERDSGIQLPTSRSPRTIAISLGDDPTKAWHPVLLAADRSRAVRALKLQLRNGAAVLYSGYVSYDGVPTVTKNEEMTVPLNFAMVGTPLRYNPAP